MKEQVMRRTMILAAAAWMCATGTLLHSSAVSRHPTASTEVVAGRDPIATRVLSAAVLMPSPPRRGRRRQRPCLPGGRTARC